jgi:hypothetical protein
LESEGLNCYVFDEHIIAKNPLKSQSIGGIKLKVNKKDSEKELVILKQMQQN